MPLKARIDAPGVLQHIICHGIERRNIFWTNENRDDLVERLGSFIEETSTDCYAWALLSNHFRFLPKNRKHVAVNAQAAIVDRLCCAFQSSASSQWASVLKPL